MTPAGAPILELRSITKRYEGHPVLKGVSMAVAAGEIHALVGENGAGKSTLMNILFGMPVIAETGGYEGEIRLAGRPVRFGSPQAAMASGIGMVHQEFMLLPGFTVAENVKLNREPVRTGPLARMLGGKLATLDRARMGRDTRAALDRAGLDLDAWAPVAGLPVGHKQFVEIAREIDKSDARIIIFDEPTAVLTEGDAAEILAAMKALARAGLGIVFITHRLDEIFQVASRITVLRDGEVVASREPQSCSVGELAELMVGRPYQALAHRAPAVTGANGPQDPSGTSQTPARGASAPVESHTLSDVGELRGVDDLARHEGVPRSTLGHATDSPSPPPALRVVGLRVDMPGERAVDIAFELRRGEILGVAGLAGQGKIGIANGLMGLYPAEGSVEVGGVPLALGDPCAAIRAGLAFVPEDRRGAGLLLDESIEMNIALTALVVQNRYLHPFPVGGLRLLDRRAARAHTEAMIARLDIRCSGPGQLVRRLSGGNQQKVALARAMTLAPDVLLVSEPTRGIDIQAKSRVLGILAELNAAGTSLLVTSSELAELRALCHRILVVHAGRVDAELSPEDSDRAFGLAMAGEAGARA